ncbi:MAG TPA: type II TA system antitoxin MqsA family protein [Candidatus Sulfotelmatobacter sp.]
MPIRCVNCGKAEFESKVIELAGTVRGSHYVVTMLGLKCPHCGHQTIDGAEMPEYGRLLADKYRKDHGLLTSEDIRSRRNHLGLNQEEFARYLGVGVASIKRWEMGKIQDTRNNALIVDKTSGWVNSILTYQIAGVSTGSTVKLFGSCEPTIISSATITFDVRDRSALAVNYFNDATKEPMYCDHCKQTGWAIELPNHQTVPPYMAVLFHDSEERKSHARYRN